MMTYIFDFAGVISVGRFFPVIAENLSKKFGVDFDVLKNRLYENQEQILLGRESTESFWKKVCEDLPILLADFTLAFREWDLNQDTVDLIRQLKKRHRVVLLSDNFEPTVKYLRSQLLFKELFEKMYFSNELHMTKGSSKIFEYVLKDLNIDATECIFIDDQEKNLIEPRKLGIRSLLFSSAQSLRASIQI